MQPSDELNLLTLQNELNQWRSTRETRYIPPKIKARAVALLENHKVSAVINALGINSKMLNQWKQQCDSSEPPNINFVSLPAIPSQTAPFDVSGLALKISISTPDSATLSLEGNLSLEHWHSAITLLNSLERRA